MKNSADLGGCYPPRPSASVTNTLLDLQNSSYPTQPHSIIANYTCFGNSAWHVNYFFHFLNCFVEQSDGIHYLAPSLHAQGQQSSLNIGKNACTCTCVYNNPYCQQSFAATWTVIISRQKFTRIKKTVWQISAINGHKIEWNMRIPALNTGGTTQKNVQMDKTRKRWKWIRKVVGLSTCE